MVLNYGTLFQTKLGKANPYHAFKRKLLVTISKFPYTVHNNLVLFVNNHDVITFCK